MSTDPRLPLFEELQRAAVDRGVQGLVWTGGHLPNGQTGCMVTNGNSDEAAQVEVVWPAHGSFHNFPLPGATAHYRVEFVRTERYNICFPNKPGCLTTEVDVVLDTLASWRDRPVVPSPRTGIGLDEAYLKRLSKIAEARRAAIADPSFVNVDDSARTAMGWSADDEQEVSRRVAVDFPREDDGRLMLGATVLLCPIGTPSGTELQRSDWLAGVGPAKRKDAQTVTISVQNVIPANHPYRWDSFPALWDPRLPQPTPAERWGVDVDPSTLGVKNREARLAELRKTCTKGGGSEAERASLGLLLQDAGLFGEAFGLYGIEANEDVWRVASGGMLHRGLEKEQEAWTLAVSRALFACAPWKVAKLIAEAEHKGKKAPRYRLFALPHQTQVSKTSLMLTSTGKTRQARFELEGNGSNLRFPEIRWQRAVDLDIIRFGFSDK